MSFLPRTHVKEYLVGLINGHRLDPIQLLDLDQVRILHGRERIEVPPREQGQTDDQYHQLLKEVFNTMLRAWLALLTLFEALVGR